MQAGLIQGGQALNIIPDHCTLDVEARAISGIDPATLLAPVRDAAEVLRTSGVSVEWEELSAYPALSLARARRSGTARLNTPKITDRSRAQVSERMPTAAGCTGLSTLPSGAMQVKGRASPVLRRIFGFSV
ncbi:acetylornithine deacetylase/succinyl-diaminopimelate desuccinylase-like protein [Ensifer sp. 4252]